MKAKELRQKYLDFFESKGHAIVSSASLIPENDPSTLFTSSGMQAMVPYLLGEKHPQGNRIANSQKCFRAIDIDEVGDNRHTTFFEMLGNWSLGDYFKKEQITWMFEFLTKELNLDPNRIYITVYQGSEKFNIPKDSEAVSFWQEQFAKVGIKAEVVADATKTGMDSGRIFYFDEHENWWSRSGVPENMPVGEPGGFDSEMFWDLGKDLKLHENSEFSDKACSPACDCGRFIEIGNNVFMQYQKTENGFSELKSKNIDFGGGLERLAMAINDINDIYLTDIFSALRNKLEDLSQKKYGEIQEELKSFRVIMDHLRGATFLLSDGALPGNKDQGYFSRRLIRRAVRFAYNLGINDNFCSEIAKTIISEYGDYYENLKSQESVIISELDKEENKFKRTLENGIKKIESLFASYEGSLKEFKISVDMLFDLYQSYGFPVELSFEEINKIRLEKGGMRMPADVANSLMEGFSNKLKKHQELSRTASAGKFKGGLADSSEETTKLHTAAHLLLAALRQVLGGHVTQKGSNITAERLRFDFAHSEKMSPEEIEKVESLVNSAITADYPVTCEELSLAEAKQRGAMGVFDSKYENRVKVYTVSPLVDGKVDLNNTFSQEICGGPHVEHTGVMGKFRIVKESSSSAGVRRIKAVLE